MSKFRKLPVEIEAVRITEKMEIQTREGTLFGYPGEWLITGVEGEKYPCGDEIFRKTYEPTGLDKCNYCSHDYSFKGCRDCALAHTCIFTWKEPLEDITVGTAGANR